MSKQSSVQRCNRRLVSTLGNDTPIANVLVFTTHIVNSAIYATAVYSSKAYQSSYLTHSKSPDVVIPNRGTDYTWIVKMEIFLPGPIVKLLHRRRTLV